MILAEYPKIGSTVNFVCHGEDDEPVLGSGIVLAIVLDPSKRIMATLETDEDVEHSRKRRRNVYLSCLEPTESFIRDFKQVAQSVRELSDNGNKQSAEIVERFNKMIDEAQSVVLGASVVF